MCKGPTRPFAGPILKLGCKIDVHRHGRFHFKDAPKIHPRQKLANIAKMSSPVEALPSNILVRSAISLKPQRLTHPPRIAIDVGAQLQLARLIHIGREIFKMNRQRLGK